MKLSILAVAGALALGLSACSQADQKAEQQADALESQAAATSNEAQEKALNAQADQVEQQAGNADGGATTGNTPSTEPPAASSESH